MPPNGPGPDKDAVSWQSPLGPDEGTQQEFEAETGVHDDMDPETRAIRLSKWLQDVETSNADAAVRIEVISEYLVARQQTDGGGTAELSESEIQTLIDHLSLLRVEEEQAGVSVSLKIEG